MFLCQLSLSSVPAW